MNFKTTKLILTGLLFIFALVSCDKNENITQKKENSFNELQSNISTLNNIFYTKHSISQTNIQKGPFWNRLKLIAISDLSGAICGGLAAGGAGSVGGAILFSLGGAIGPLPEGYVVTTNTIPSIKTNGIEIGEIHNIIIQEIIEENPTLFNEPFNSARLIDLVNAKLIQHNIDTVPKSKLNLIFNQKSKEMTDAIQQSNSVSEAMNILSSSKPELKSEVAVIEQYLNTVSQIKDQEVRIEYTQEFMDVVEQSNIPISSKDQINSGLVVFENSSVLWNK